METADAPGDAQPGLGGEILRVAGLLGSQVAKDRGIQALVQLAHGPGRARARGVHDGIEVLPEAHEGSE